MIDFWDVFDICFYLILFIVGLVLYFSFKKKGKENYKSAMIVSVCMLVCLLIKIVSMIGKTV